MCVWGGNQESLCPAKRLHMWEAEWGVSQISHHLGERPLCQEKSAGGEERGKNDKVKDWVRIHGGKVGLIEELTERKPTNLDGCCFHLLSWPNIQHLSFLLAGLSLGPSCLPSYVCVCGCKPVKPIPLTKEILTLCLPVTTPLTALPSSSTHTVPDRNFEVCV